MTSVPLIPSDPERSHSMLVREGKQSQPIVDGETGTTDYTCPHCQTVLLAHMSPAQVKGEFGQIFQCGSCGKHSELPEIL